MYANGLEWTVLGRFEDHDGFDGIIVGRPDGPYHLEFTHRRAHRAGPPPDAENLLVLYLPDRAAWDERCARMRSAGFRFVPATNPYWDAHGRTFEDADGYRMVIQNARWGD